jgi:phosphatidylglycerophosphatase A
MATTKDFLKSAVVTVLGCGYAPFMPGTVGTLPAVAAYLAIVLLAPPAAQIWIIGSVLILACALTVWLGFWAERRWGKDPQHVVLDEFAGFLVTVLIFRAPSLAATVVWAFLLTRLFDMIKPPPCRRLEKLPGGWGILLDDVWASLYAAAVLNLMLRYCPQFFAWGF